MHHHFPGHAKDACVTVLEKLGAARGGPCRSQECEDRRKEGKASTKLGVRARPSLPPGCLLNIFLTSCGGLPGPGLGAPACPSPCWGREQRPERGGGGRVTPHPFAPHISFVILLPQRCKRTELSYVRGCTLHTVKVYRAVKGPTPVSKVQGHP